MAAPALRSMRLLLLLALAALLAQGVTVVAAADNTNSGPTQTMKLILKVAGADYPLTQSKADAVMAAVNSLSAPVVFEFRTQQASAPGRMPAVDGATVVAAPAPPAAPAPAGGNGGGNRRLLAQLPGVGGAAAALSASAARRRSLQQGDATDVPTNDCPNPTWNFYVADFNECQDRCNKKVVGKNATVAPEQLPSVSGAYLCCDCHYKKTDGTPTTVDNAPAQPDTSAPAGQDWWPQSNVTAPLNIDGVYVFADGQVEAINEALVRGTLTEAAVSGLLCTTINDYGGTCKGARVMYSGTGAIVFVQEPAPTAAASSASSGGGGLSTGAIIGIACGGAAVLAVVCVALYLFVSRRHERAVSRAAAQRTKARRVDFGPPTDSAWRAAYSQRMQDTMRRTEEAAAQQKEEAARQAAEKTPKLSSKKSFGRSMPPPSTDVSAVSAANMMEVRVDESPDNSLMTGSELSSPAPSLSASKSGRSRSLLGLFGK